MQQFITDNFNGPGMFITVLSIIIMLIALISVILHYRERANFIKNGYTEVEYDGGERDLDGNLIKSKKWVKNS